MNLYYFKNVQNNEIQVTYMAESLAESVALYLTDNPEPEEWQYFNSPEEYVLFTTIIVEVKDCTCFFMDDYTDSLHFRDAVIGVINEPPQSKPYMLQEFV